jgi:hypothetical protein
MYTWRSQYPWATSSGLVTKVTKTVLVGHNYFVWFIQSQPQRLDQQEKTNWLSLLEEIINESSPAAVVPLIIKSNNWIYIGEF